MTGRLAFFVGAVVLAESAFYAVVPPLVPGFVHEAHMTTTQVGILVAAYPAGVLVATLPSMALIDWRGVRVGTGAGLVLLVLATLGFAWGTSPLALNVARFVQGIGGALAWAGALAWLTSASPVQRRASVIGTTLGAALIGMVMGPSIGAVASQVGRGLMFTAIALVLALLAVMLPASSSAPIERRGSLYALGGLFRNAQAALGIALLGAVGIVTGTIAALMPLLVSRQQGSAAVIAIILAASYLIGSLLNVTRGRFADRIGRVAPTLLGFAVATVILPSLPFWTSVISLAVATIVATSFVTSLWTPITAMVSDGAAQGTSGQAAAIASLNAAWAAGAAAGAVAASWVAERAGFPIPFALLSALCAASVVVLALRSRGGAIRFSAVEPNQ
jgi:MFS family permease